MSVLLRTFSASFNPRLRGAPPEIPFILDAPTLLRGMNFTLTTDIGDLDLLGEISGVGQYPKVSADAEAISLYGGQCQVAAWM